MIEIGQYDQAWPDWHIGPEQAVRAHQWLRGKAFLPIHWATFSLAYRGWTEPIERAVVAAEREHVMLATPKPGARFEPDVALLKVHWWPSLPWKSAEVRPIFSSQSGQRRLLFRRGGCQSLGAARPGRFHAKPQDLGDSLGMQR